MNRTYSKWVKGMCFQPFSTARCVLVLVLALFAAAHSDAVNGKVSVHNGAPVFFFDGRPHTGLSYMTYVGSGSLGLDGVPLLARYTRGMADAGCGLFTFVVDLGGLYGYTQTVWPEPERWDFSMVDASARMVLDAAPPDAKLIIQLYIDTPEWWNNSHPGEMLQLSNGTPDFGEKLFALPRKDNLPCMVSPAWREAAGGAVQKLIEHVDASDYGARVAGYQVSGQKTQEWYHWSMNCQELGDYNPAMEAAFRHWLAERYHTDAALRAAWHSESATPGTAQIPPKEARYGNQKATFRDPPREQAVIDFHRFWSDVMADTIIYFADIVKKRTGGNKVVGGFYAYTFEFAELVEDAGHLALGRLLASPALDFIMMPSSYHRRNLNGGQSVFRTPVLSLVTHGKMLWNDFDAASFKFYEKDQKALAPWADSLGVTRTPDEFVWMFRRELGNALAYGGNMVYFDLHGGYYDDPAILRGVAECGKVREDALARDRASSAQILAVVDEDSQHFLTFRNPVSRKLLIEQVAELPFTAPFDTVLLSDLGGIPLERYRLVLMLNAFRLDGEQRRVVDEKLKRDNRMVVWLYAPGLFRGDGTAMDPAGIAEASGIVATPSPRPEGAPAAVLAPAFSGGMDSLSIPLLQAEQFVVADSGAECVASNGGQTVIGLKEFPGWTSVLAGAAPLPRQTLRELARRAGVHLYHENPDDSVYANGSYLTVAASTGAGRRTLYLPFDAAVHDAITGEVLCENSRQFTAEFKSMEVRIFEINREGPRKVSTP